jgi:hypothetical protein
MENTIKIDDLEVPRFQETSIWSILQYDCLSLVKGTCNTGNFNELCLVHGLWWVASSVLVGSTLYPDSTMEWMGILDYFSTLFVFACMGSTLHIYICIHILIYIYI